MSQYILEGPITSNETDQLSRAPHVKMIADLLTDNSKLGYVVSIEGPWGSGKTSVLNLLKKQLEDSGIHSSNIVTFSPWLITDAGSLALEFLKQLSTSLSISPSGKIVDSATQKIDIVNKILKYARYLPIGGGREDLAEFSDALDAAKGTLETMKEGPQDISKRKAAVVDALRDLPSPIVVIIDDVDRLPPKDIYEIIRLVRAIGDFPNVRYVLAMDAGYVEKALEKSGIPEHAGYLDKIFHHRFIIPPVFSHDLRELLINRLRNIADAEQSLSSSWLPYEQRLDEYLNSGLASMMGSIRDINLLSNRVGLMRVLFQEINFADVVVLEALAIKAPSIYRHILQTPSAYTGAVDEHMRYDFCTSGAFKASQEARDRAARSTPPELQDITSNLVNSIFNEKSSDYYRSGTNVERAREVCSGYLSSPSRIRIAISRVLKENGITLSLINRFIIDPGIRLHIVDTIISQKGQLRALWLLNGSCRKTEEPLNAIKHLGLLLDDQSSQHSSISHEILTLAREIFKRLRREANASGNPLLTGAFGVTIPYLGKVCKTPYLRPLAG